MLIAGRILWILFLIATVPVVLGRWRPVARYFEFACRRWYRVSYVIVMIGWIVLLGIGGLFR